MRILIDIRALGQKHPSGVGEYTKQLLKALFVIDQNNQYILFNSGSQKTKQRVKNVVSSITHPQTNIELVHRSIPNKLINAANLLNLSSAIPIKLQRSTDLLFLPNLTITNIDSQTRVVLTVHDLSWKYFPEFFSQKMLTWHKAAKPKMTIKKATHIITPSNSTKQDVIHSFKKSKHAVSTIAHGINPIFESKLQAQDHGIRSKYHLPKKFVLFMGTLEPRKNIHTLIDAVNEYRNQTGDDLHLVLAGNWGWKSGKIKTHINKQWIRHLGYVKDKERPAIYRSAKTLIWPSFYEGFGLPVLEAMACGTPVITSNTSSLPEISKNAAIHIDPFNHKDIRIALEQLLSSSKLQNQLQESGLAQASTFSWKKAAQKTLEIFEKIVESRR